MAVFEIGKFGKRKAEGVILDGEPSSLPSFSTFLQVNRHAEAESAAAAAAEVGLQDPLMLFGSGIMKIILCKLDARSVALARSVSAGWLAIGPADEIWAPKCWELWLGKAHIPRMAKVPGLSKMAATSLSTMDSKRDRITRNDLCDHSWEFHFNEAAPDYWRNLDPYWQGCGPLMRRYFHQDGSITADPNDAVWGGHESGYTVVTGLVLAEGRMREHYVRINRWPKMCVARKADWSWVLSNELYCYSSIPDAGDKEDGTGPFFPVMF